MTNYIVECDYCNCIMHQGAESATETITAVSKMLGAVSRTLGCPQDMAELEALEVFRCPQCAKTVKK